MEDPSTNYMGREWSEELYIEVSNKLDQQGIRTDRVPQEIHVEALETVFEYLGTPKNLSAKQRDTFRVEDVGRFAEGYRNAIDALDMKLNGRNPHERGVDALMQRYADGDEIKDYDILINNTFYSDPAYDSWSDRPDLEDIELTGWRTLNSVVGSDADFIGVDLDNRDIDIYEVKKTNKGLDEGIREKKFRRAERQGKLALEAINSFDTEFDANSTRVLTHNLTGDRNPMPDIFEGDIQVVSDLSDRTEAAKEFSELFNKVAHETSWGDLENVERVNPTI